MSTRITPNQREVLAAVSTITGQPEYLSSTNHALNTTGGGGGGSDVQYVEGVTTTPATGTVSMGRYTTAAPTLTNGQLYGLQLDSSGNLKVSGSLSVGGTTDAASWTTAVSSFNPTGGVFNDSAAALTSGQQGTQRFTANRAGHVNLRTAAGTEIGTAASPIRTDPTGTTTQPVSLTSTTITGTVAATQSGTWNITNISGTVSLPTGAATSANQTNASQKTQIVDGSGNVIASTTNALNVAVVSGGGGGTQYVNGSAQATPTGTVALGWDGANVRALKTATDGTLKTVLSASQANVTGTITTSTSVITATDLTGVGSVTVNIAGTYAGVNVTFEASVDGTNFVPIAAMPVGSTTPSVVTSTGVLTTNSTNAWNVSPLLGMAQFRVRATAFVSGTANVTIDLSAQFVQYSSVNADVVTQPTASLLNATVTGSGTAGSAATGVQTIQGIASMTPVQVSQATAANLNATVVGTGTFAVQATLAAETTKVIGTVNQGTSPWVVAGPTASGSSLTASPQTKGGLAKTTNPTAVADAQVVNSLHDKLGKQVVTGSIRDLKANQVTTITASTAETTIVTSVASVFLDMYGLIITNTSATAVNVAIKDATAGTTRFNFAVPAGDTRGFMLPEGGAIKQTAVTNNWTATVSASVTSVIITALTVQNL